VASQPARRATLVAQQIEFKVETGLPPTNLVHSPTEHKSSGKTNT